MADEEQPVTRLQVANMRPGDSGRGIARLPRSVMESLGLAEGDVVELAGQRSTPARAVHPYPRTRAPLRGPCDPGGPALAFALGEEIGIVSTGTSLSRGAAGASVPSRDRRFRLIEPSGLGSILRRRAFLGAH